MNEDQEYLDTPQLAKHIKVSERTVFNLRMSKQIPFIRLGDRVLFRKASVDAALSKLEVTT